MLTLPIFTIYLPRKGNGTKKSFGGYNTSTHKEISLLKTNGLGPTGTTTGETTIRWNPSYGSLKWRMVRLLCGTNTTKAINTCGNFRQLNWKLILSEIPTMAVSPAFMPVYCMMGPNGRQGPAMLQGSIRPG